MPLDDNMPRVVRVSVSHNPDPGAAVAEAVGRFRLEELCFVLVFVPERLDLEELSGALKHYAPGTPFFGCTTAGQITPQGYENRALMMIGFPRAHFRCATTLIHPLAPVSIQDVSRDARRLEAQFQRTGNHRRLALLFADGLSKQEDRLVTAIEAGLDDMPVFGGSAGNGLDFNQTFVLHAGRFHSNAALLMLVETDLAFAGIGFDHFMPTETQMVLTRTIPEERLALEINGSPAAKEYARLVGCRVEDLSHRVFAENPVLVRNNNTFHVRAIQEVVEGGGLSFLSAIDDGLLLTLGRGKEIIRTLSAGLSDPGDPGGQPDFILGFDCFLRKLEIEQKNLVPDASAVLRDHRVIGFNTYGEQHCGVHVNQTFVGVAFFAPSGGSPF